MIRYAGAFDLAGDFYVAGGNGAIEYKPDLKTVKRVLADTSLPYPATDNVAYDVYDGLVAVLQRNSYDCVLGVKYSCTGAVSFYARNSITPCRTIGVTSITDLVAGAFAAGGDLYVVGFGVLNAPQLSVIHGGCSATSAEPLSTGNTLHGTGGIQINPQNQIVIADAALGELYTYANPFKRSGSPTSLGMPIKTSLLAGIANSNLPAFTTFIFTTTGDGVWILNPTTGGYNKYRYPAGGNAIAASMGGGNGIAIYPPEFPHFDY